MDWDLLRKTLTPDIGWSSFLASIFGFICFILMGTLIISGIAYGLTWLVGQVAVLIVSSCFILYVIAIEPLIERYKRLKWIRGLKNEV